jgi:hypothetical protein
MDRIAIRNIARVEHDKQKELERLGRLDTSGLTPTQMREHSLEYEVAKAELFNARSDLRAAQGK